jgi:hypothetical protein
LLRALDAARETLYQRRRANELVPPVSDPATEAPTRAQQRADALALLAETALHHELDPGTPGERSQVVVHVDADVLAGTDQPGQSVLEEGPHVSAETSRRLACDASRVVMRHDGEGRVVEVGARTRTVPPALRRALHYRDGSCRFPGCHVKVSEAHHVRHWAQGGPTTLSNLALLSAGAIIGRCTRKATGSSDSPTVRYASGGRMGDPCPRCQCRRRCPRIRQRRCGHGTWRRACGFTGARDSRAGSGSGSTWAGRSTCCTQGRGTMRLSPSRFAQRRSPRPHPIPDRPASGAGRPAWCPSSAPKGDTVSEPYREEAGVSFAIDFSAMPWKIFRPRLNIATNCWIA